MASRAPKQWCLTREETVNYFENWRQNLQYVLTVDSAFSMFIQEGGTWRKKTKDTPLRGFVDDASTATGVHQTAS